MLLPEFKEPVPVEPDFGGECREAFLRLSGEARAIERRGYDSEREYQKKAVAIDGVLDQYLDWCDIEAL